jgi:predicted ATPase/DNA-binding XRE family transcriptional regulator
VLSGSCPQRFSAPSDNPNNHTNNFPNKGVLRCREAVRTVQDREATKVEASKGSTFGELLRSYRDSANLTQEELAGRTGLTPQAIGLLERGERRRPHRYTVQKLAEALELRGEDHAAFEAAARRSSAYRAAVEPSHRNLPVPLTSLIGREREVAAIASLVRLENTRLLTLTGPGGVGKTRLALEVAESSHEAFADGVVFVPLAPLRDAALLPSVLAETLGVKEVSGEPLQETLEKHLQDKQMLLVLDNFEHLLTAAPAVSELVGRCRQLTVLVTSRAPLRLGGEHQFPVPPLPLPEAEILASGSIPEHHSPAVELFLQRAQAVMPTFELAATNSAAVARICRRLDGLPLAIELAAARIKLFSPQALLGMLDRSLRLLTGGARDLPARQQTLRDTVAWSHNLLNPTEQALFCRLAVFAGGCSLEAVEAVCGSRADEEVASGVVESLASLVDNSLLVARSQSLGHQQHEELRFTMLETIREYALERLTSSGELEEVQRKHARYYVELGEVAQPVASKRWDEAEWWAKFTRIEREHDNLRAALGWAVQYREVETGARLAIALWWFWIERGYLSDGRRWMEALLALEEAGKPTGETQRKLPARTKARLIHVTGILSMVQGDHDRAVVLHEAALTMYWEMGHKKGESASLRELGFVAYERGDYERAARLHERSLDLAREFGTTFSIAWSLRALGDAVREQGDLRRAKTLLEESLALSRGEEHAWGVVRTLASLGSVECEAGEYARASGLYEESLNLGRRLGMNLTILRCLEGLARVAVAQGRMERAAWLCGAAAALREDKGWPNPPAKRAEHDRIVADARKALGGEVFAAAWASGHALPLDEAVRDTLLGNGA